MLNEYPIFKNGIAYIDHTVIVDQATALDWEEGGITKIVTLTHGIDHINQTHLPVENRPGINTDSTAQWCVWKLLEWAYSQEPPIETTKKTVLFIGMGRIGKKLSELLLYWFDYENVDEIDCSWFEDYELYESVLKQKIPKAEIIFLCINPEKNTGFWNKEKLFLMKKTAVLISPSRPIIFSEEALKDKRIIWDIEHIAWRTDEVLKRKKEAIE